MVSESKRNIQSIPCSCHCSNSQQKVYFKNTRRISLVFFETGEERLPPDLERINNSMPECQGQRAHIHMAGTMQTVIYAAHHHPDSAFNPDLEKKHHFLLTPAASSLPGAATRSPWGYRGEVPPNPSAFPGCNSSLCSQQLHGHELHALPTR